MKTLAKMALTTLDVVKIISFLTGIALALGGFFGITFWAGVTVVKIMNTPVHP